MIVVVDTNIWISALLFGGPASTPTRALRIVVRDHTIAISQEQRTEIVRVLIRKGRWEPDRVEAVLQLLLLRSNSIRLTHTTHLCRDPKDDMFLECAALSKAEVLISGDQDLLALKSHHQTRIVTASEFLQQYTLTHPVAEPGN